MTSKNNNIFVGQKLVLPEGVYLDDEKNIVSPKSSVRDTTKIKNQGNVNISSNRLDATTFIWPARGSVITRFGQLQTVQRWKVSTLAQKKVQSLDSRHLEKLSSLIKSRVTTMSF